MGTHPAHVEHDEPTPNEASGPQSIEESSGPLRGWVWGVALGVPCLFIVATAIRTMGGIGTLWGVDWNAAGDSAWVTLVGLGQSGPFGTAIAAIIAALALSQKWKADERSAWWSRVAWAADHSMSEDDETQLIGISALSAIRAGSSPSTADTGLLKAIGQRPKRDEIDELAPEQDNDSSVAQGGHRVDLPEEETAHHQRGGGNPETSRWTVLRESAVGRWAQVRRRQRDQGPDLGERRTNNRSES